MEELESWGAKKVGLREGYFILTTIPHFRSEDKKKRRIGTGVDRLMLWLWEEMTQVDWRLISRGQG